MIEDLTGYEDRRFWPDSTQVRQLATLQEMKERGEIIDYWLSPDMKTVNIVPAVCAKNIEVTIGFMTPAQAIIMASKMQGEDEIKREAESFVKDLISNVHNLRKFNPNGHPDLQT